MFNPHYNITIPAGKIFGDDRDRALVSYNKTTMYSSDKHDEAYSMGRFPKLEANEDVQTAIFSKNIANRIIQLSSIENSTQRRYNK